MQLPYILSSYCRNTQTLRVRQLFLSNSKPAFQLAGFILEEDTVWDQEPVVGARLTEYIESIDDLRTLLSSCEMYTNQPLHDLWCEALESGYFRGAPQKDSQSIENTISIAMEAHFRYPHLRFFSRLRILLLFVFGYLALNYGMHYQEEISGTLLIQ